MLLLTISICRGRGRLLTLCRMGGGRGGKERLAVVSMCRRRERVLTLSPSRASVEDQYQPQAGKVY